MDKVYRIKQIQNLFETTITREALLQAENNGLIPKADRQKGGVKARFWNVQQLPLIGERYGFLKKLSSPTVVTVFTTKGGSYKSTLSYNIARLSALHNIKTLAIGLDLQCDLTTLLGLYSDSIENLEDALLEVDEISGLGSYFNKQKKLDDIIQQTDIPSLYVIPETPDLSPLERAISITTRREFWFKENVIEQLKNEFELIVIDCPPSWSQLISNALVACDILISPIECQINHFRNLETFRKLSEEFRNELNLNYQHIFVPTKYTPTRKLSGEILSWYLKNVSNVTVNFVRESVFGEEANASNLSLLEYAPTQLVAHELRELLKEIWVKIASPSLQINKKVA